MNTADQLPEELIARANRLYWNSDRSVNQLANELGLSKGTLYEIIGPLPTGASCPKGDGELVYLNRTAQNRGEVSCPACGFKEEEQPASRPKEEVTGKARSAEAPTQTASRTQIGGSNPPQPFTPKSHDHALPVDVALRAPSAERLLVAGSLVAGIGVGLILACVLRRS